MPEGGDDETIRIRAILEDELSEPADRIDQSLSNLRDSMNETADSADGLTDAERRNESQGQRSIRQIRAQNQERDEQGRFIRNNTTDTETETTTIRRNTRERDKSSKSIKKSKNELGKLGGVWKMLFKAMGALDLVAQAGVAVGALGAAAVAAGAGISAMSGALLPLPSLLAGMAQTGIVAKMAFGGMGDAIGALASGDFAKFSEATKDFAPEAIASAKAIGELGQQTKSWKKEIQGKVFDGLAPMFTDLGGKILPLVKDSFMKTAGSINVAAKDLLGFVNSGEGVRQIGNIMRGNATISDSFARGLAQAGKGMIGLMSATMPVAVQMADDIQAGFEGLSNAIQNNQEKIRAFAQRGYELFARFVGILVDLAKGIYNIGKQGMGLAGFMGKGFEDMARKFKDWTASAEGQQKINKWFEDAKPVLQAIGRLIGAIGKAFGALMTGDNNQLVSILDRITAAVPTLLSLVQKAGDTGMIDNLVKIAAALLDIIDNMNAMGPMAILMSAVAEPTQMLADAFGALPAPIQQAIGYLVMFTLAVRSMAATTAGAWILNALGLTAWGNYFKLVMLSAVGNLRAFVVAQYAAARAAGASRIGAAWAVLTAGIGKAVKAVRAFGIAQRLAFLGSPIGLIIAGIALLVTGFILLWKHSETFRNIIKSIGRWFVNVWNGTLYPLIMATWEWMKTAWNAIWNTIKTVVSAIVNFFKSAWNVIKVVAMVVFTVLKVYFKIMVAVWTTIFKVWWAVVSTVFKVLMAVGRVVFLTLRLLFFAAVQAMIFIFKIFANIFMIGWRILMAVVRAVVGVIVAIWNVAFGVVKAVFMAVWNTIMAVVRFLTPIVQAVINAVVLIFQTGWNIVMTVVRFVVGIISAIINTIVGIVQSIINTIINIWNVGFNAVASVVRPIIDTIGNIISGVGDTVGRVVEGIKGAFTRGFQAIKNFVSPILDTIKSVIESIVNLANSIGDKIGSLGDAINPFSSNFAGGPIVAGERSLIGELGPEAFVSHTGKVEMIGTRGPEIMDFNKPGYIVPNHVLGGVPDPSVPAGVMSKLASAMSPQESQLATAGAPKAGLSGDDYMSHGGGDSYLFDFSGANLGGMSPADVEKAVERAVRKTKRNDDERG